MRGPKMMTSSSDQPASWANAQKVGVSWKDGDATFIDAYRGQGELTSNLKAILFSQSRFCLSTELRIYGNR